MADRTEPAPGGGRDVTRAADEQMRDIATDTLLGLFGGARDVTSPRDDATEWGPADELAAALTSTLAYTVTADDVREALRRAEGFR